MVILKYTHSSVDAVVIVFIDNVQTASSSELDGPIKAKHHVVHP